VSVALPENPHGKAATGIHFPLTFRNCILFIIGVFLFNGLTQAEPLLVQQEDVFDAPLFAAELVQPFKPTACTIETVSGFVLDTNRPIIAHCGENDIAVSGISKVRRGGDSEEATHVVVSLSGRQQKAVRTVLRLQDFPAEFVDGVEVADLNGDGKDDFILNLSTHGNGLAAKFGGSMFLLSDNDEYRYLALANVIKSASNYVHFGSRRQTVLVLQRMVLDRNGSHSVRGQDRMMHTFFVFDLLEFDTVAAKGVKLNNRLDPRFPFWIRYTDKPSHTETKRISGLRKRALWRDPMALMVSGWLIER
jgi:hypothetical protein